MRCGILALLLPLLLVMTACATARDTAPLSRSRQLLLVVSSDWTATTATLRRFERSGSAEPWREVGAPVPAMLGRSGLAWGRGVHQPQADGPQKREGDGKSPAGIYRFETAFGFSATPAGIRLPYLELTESTECVDDASSAFYNRIVQRKAVPQVDWSSSEKMRSIAVYRWGAVVLHNERPYPGGGSCIFLHLSNGGPTSGCTSMDEPTLTAILGWLDPRERPLLVQLPEQEYARLKGEWALP